MKQQHLSDVSVKGRTHRVPSVEIDGRVVVVQGRYLRIASVRDAHLISGEVVPEPQKFIRRFSTSGLPADLFTFSQAVDEGEPRFDFPFEWDNAAVAFCADYDRWWQNLPQESRKNVRRAGKRGVTVDVVSFDDTLVSGIKELYDESPIRQGRRFWHFGKALETVRAENSSYLDRSQFIGAYHDGKLIGFLKMVYVGQVATIMQILAKMSEQDKRPMNALIAKAMEVCHQRGMTHFVYSKFTFGNKKNDDMAEFKRRNGFVQVNFPRYYVPLTVRGRLGFGLRLHRGVLGILPPLVIARASRWRARLLDYQFRDRHAAPVQTVGEQSGESV